MYKIARCQSPGSAESYGGENSDNEQKVKKAGAPVKVTLPFSVKKQKKFGEYKLSK